MKLYNADLSPYAARVRVAIYAKSLPVELVAPPPGALFGQMNPATRDTRLVEEKLAELGTRLLPAVGGKNPLAGRPRLARVAETVARHPAVAKVLAEQGEAMAQMTQARGR